MVFFNNQWEFMFKSIPSTQCFFLQVDGGQVILSTLVQDLRNALQLVHRLHDFLRQHFRFFRCQRNVLGECVQRQRPGQVGVFEILCQEVANVLMGGRENTRDIS